METLVIQNEDFKLKKVVAESLNIDESKVTDGLSYRSIKEWDSLGHISLLLKIEEIFEMEIDEDLRDSLNSVADIKRLILQNGSLHQKTQDISVKRGLANIVFDYTAISDVDGKNGRLSYRGVNIDYLVKNCLYEEIVYLLLYGTLPTHESLEGLKEDLYINQSITHLEENIISSLKGKPLIDVLKAFIVINNDNKENFTDIEKAKRLIAKLPLIISLNCTNQNNLPARKPLPNVTYAENLFYLITGEYPKKEQKEVLNRILILHAEHSSNASAFAARITASTLADFHSSILSAISTFSGPLHGGAIEGVMEMVEEISDSNSIEEYIKGRLEQSEPIMGFGHRVYQTLDPRAKWMKEDLFTLCTIKGELKDYFTLQEIVENMGAYIEKGMDVNVDFYASLIYANLGFSKEVFLSLFIVGRMAGWCAHILEQKDNNVLIRPLLQFRQENIL